MLNIVFYIVFIIKKEPTGLCKSLMVTSKIRLIRVLLAKQISKYQFV